MQKSLWHDERHFLEVNEVTEMLDKYHAEHPEEEITFLEFMNQNEIYEKTPGSQFWYKKIKVNPDASVEYLEREEPQNYTATHC